MNEKRRRKKTVSERILTSRRSLFALREPPRRLEKVGKWAKNSKKEKGQTGLAIGQPFMNGRGR